MRNRSKISIKQAILPIWDFILGASLLFLVVMSVGLIIISKIDHQVTRDARAVIVDFAAPIMGFASKPVVTFNKMREDVSLYFGVYQRNEELTSRNKYLEKNQAIIEQLQLENQNLREVTNYLPTTKIFYKTARLIGDNAGIYSKSGIIDAGKNDGLKHGQIVTNGDGLIGRLFDVGNRSSRVLYITDINSRIPVSVGQNGQRAILVGNNSQDIYLKFVAENAEISIGDVVVTSADGKLFPNDLPVGIVRSITKDSIIIKAFASCNNIEYITILDVEQIIK